MELDYLAPIVLLLVSNVFMTFAWVRSGLPQANEMVRWTISSDERPELGEGQEGRRPLVHLPFSKIEDPMS